MDGFWVPRTTFEKFECVVLRQEPRIVIPYGDGDNTSVTVGDMVIRRTLFKGSNGHGVLEQTSVAVYTGPYDEVCVPMLRWRGAKYPELPDVFVTGDRFFNSKYQRRLVGLENMPEEIVVVVLPDGLGFMNEC